MRIAHLAFIGLLLLSGCSSYAPPANLTGVDRDALLARMGQPDMARQTATG
ncbi:MAG: hypothetical protein IBX54_14745, partial [Rhodoferax sp.]|nr:hypothetical protein [Rhodoferax sp.]